LQTVQILAMHRRYELTRDQAQKHPWGEIVLPQTLAQLSIL
jgi:hypothetical protein